MQKIPLTLLTGFLGSGKTTLLNHLLKMPMLTNSAVLINEFGEIALDHHLVEAAVDNPIVLDNGCICCTIRGALSGALRTLFWQRQEKKIPAFDRVIIETTGLADPAPILHELLGHPTILHHYRLAGVIACVDGVFGAKQLDQHIEALKQAAVADRLLITKTDLCQPGDIAALSERLNTLNPAAELHSVSAECVDVKVIVDDAMYDPLGKNMDVQQWLKAETYRRVAVKPGFSLSTKALLRIETDSNRHGERIQSYCLTFDRPLPWEGLCTGLEMLAMLRGEYLLRVKGIVNVLGEDKPRVIHGVQYLFFPPTHLDQWPDEQRETKLVFIVQGLELNFITHTLEHFIASANPQVVCEVAE